MPISVPMPVPSAAEQKTLRRVWKTVMMNHPELQCQKGAKNAANASCALQLLSDLIPYRKGTHKDLASLAEEYAGLTEQQAYVVIMLNDGIKSFRDYGLPTEHYPARPRTFAEIVKVLNAWFPDDEQIVAMPNRIPTLAQVQEKEGPEGP